MSDTALQQSGQSLASVDGSAQRTKAKLLGNALNSLLTPRAVKQVAASYAPYGAAAVS